MPTFHEMTAAQRDAIRRDRHLSVVFRKEIKSEKARAKRARQEGRRAKRRLKKLTSPRPTPPAARPVKPKQIQRPPKLKKRPKYAEYIVSDLWRAVCRWRKSLAGNKCEQCGHPHKLEVHHKHYNTVGREAADDLAVLCEECHERFHEGLIQSKAHLAAIQGE